MTTNKGNRPKPSGQMTKARRSVDKVTDRGETFTVKTKVTVSLKGEQIMTKNGQTSYDDNTITANLVSVSTNGVEVQTPNRISSEATSSLQSVHIVGDGVGVVPLSDEEGKLPLGIPVVYVDDKNEYYATFSVDQTASILEIEPSKVTRWIDSGKLVGFEDENGEMRAPKAQIRDGRVAPFLDKLAHIYEKPSDLWQYLVTEKRVQNERVRPLDVHFQEDLKRALNLSISLRMDFT